MQGRYATLTDFHLAFAKVSAHRHINHPLIDSD